VTPNASRSHATFAVATLFFANLVGYLDRRTLALLANPVRPSQSLTDGEIGLIQCPAFVIAFVTVGLSVGGFTSGIYVGFGLSLVALILPAVTAYATTLSKSGFAVEPWQLVMLAPGAISCLSLCRMREPARRQASSANGAGSDDGETWTSKRSFFIPHHLSLSCVTFGTSAVATWLPTVLLRNTV